jgi:hypothetical protein
LAGAISSSELASASWSVEQVPGALDLAGPVLAAQPLDHLVGDLDPDVGLEQQLL